MTLAKKTLLCGLGYGVTPLSDACAASQPALLDADGIMNFLKWLRLPTTGLYT